MLPIIGAVVGLTVLGLGGNWFLNGRFEIATDNAYVRSDITNVAAKVQGYVSSVNIVANKQVKTGDLLFSIDNADYKARSRKQTPPSRRRRPMRSRPGPASPPRAPPSPPRNRAPPRQRDQLAQAEATSDWQSSDLKRLSELAEKGWYPKARVEQAQSTEKAARRRHGAAEPGDLGRSRDQPGPAGIHRRRRLGRVG